MFNLSGSEIIVILLVALVVLGPEKLPEALRRFGRVYGELKRVSKGFQSEFTQAFQEPIDEIKETARLTREAVTRPFNEAIDEGPDDTKRVGSSDGGVDS